MDFHTFCVTDNLPIWLRERLFVHIFGLGFHMLHLIYDRDAGLREREREVF